MNNLTPLGVDAYSRFQAGAFDERAIIGVPTGFQSIFGRRETGSETVFADNSKLVEIDIIRANERTAQLIPRGTESRPLTGQENTIEEQYSHFSRLYPLIEEEGDVSADQLLNRLAGDNPYLQRTTFERARALGTKYHQEQIRRIIRAFERSAAESVLDGQQVSVTGTTNADLIYDFLRKSTHTFTVSTLWDAATPDILADIDTACGLIRADAHVTPDYAILGSEASAAFIADTSITTLADTRRYELVLVSNNNPVPPQLKFLQDGGMIARGKLTTPDGWEIWLFSYLDVFTSSAGAATKYMPVDKVLVGSSRARCDRYFGPPEMLPLDSARLQFMAEMFGISAGGIMPANIKAGTGVITPAMFHFDAYAAPTHKFVSIRTQASAIFATTMTDAFVTMTVT